MNKLIGFISAAFGILAFLAVLLTWYAYHNSGGMAVLGFQVWALIAGIAAILLGIVAHFLPRPETEIAPGSARFGIGFGLGALLSLAIAMLFLG